MKSVAIKRLVGTLIAICILAAGSQLSMAQASEPEGVTPTILSSERRAATSATSIDAIAGNVTELDIVSVAITQTWAGFFGNVSGTITLDSAGSSTLYDWQLTSPQGEIYAVNETITWTNISCFNYTADGAATGGELNLTEYEAYLAIDPTDADGIDETFTSANHPQFFVGAVTVASNTCNTTHTYVNDSAQTTSFKEVLLYEPDKDLVVFTSLLEQDVFGFDNRTHDFQMLVAENGHNADSTATPHYFYVEIE